MKINRIYVLKWLLLVVFEERTIFLAFSWRGGAQYCNAVAVAVAVAVPAVAAFPQVRGGAPTTLTAVPFVALRCIPFKITWAKDAGTRRVQNQARVGTATTLTAVPFAAFRLT
jgi:hypothetical protein